MKIPTYDEMMNPLLEAVKQLGGSGTIHEINEKVFEIMKLPNNVIEIPHAKAAQEVRLSIGLLGQGHT